MVYFRKLLFHILLSCRIYGALGLEQMDPNEKSRLESVLRQSHKWPLRQPEDLFTSQGSQSAVTFALPYLPWVARS